MNDHQATAPAAPSSPVAPAGGGSALASSPPAGRPVPTPRAAAIEAGRWFHRARLLAHELTLSGRARAACRLTEGVIPALVAAVGEMAPQITGEVEWGLASWLRSLAAHLSGLDYVEWLDDQQRSLDARTECERAEFDLSGARARLLSETHAEFDERRENFLAAVPPSEATAFRLGEAIEAGAYPLDAHEAAPELGPEEAPTFGAPAPRDEGPRGRLVLAQRTALACDRPWHSWWPASVRSLWVACGLNAADAALPEGGCSPAEADSRNQIIEALATRAANCFEVLDRPPVAVEDRLRIVDEGAQEVSLDGDSFVVEHRAAFLILRALLRAPGNQLTRKKLNELDACKGDISKFLSYLPERLRALVCSRPGPNALYYLQLPPRQQLAN